MYDCGVCGYPDCATLARRISIQKGLLGRCPFISVTQQEKIREYEEALASKIPPKIIPKQSQVQPCVVEGKITLEVQLPPSSGSPFPVFDVLEMCHDLRTISIFSKVRCAHKLGYAICTWGEKIIHVYNTGKIVLRRIANKEEGLKALKIITRGIWPAVISQCGTVTADALAGVCLVCEKLLCGGLQWVGVEGDTYVNTKHVKLAFTQLMTPGRNKYVDEAWQIADGIFQKLTYCRDELKEEIPEIKKQMDQFAKIITFTLIRASDKLQMIGALGLHGIRRNFERVLSALMNAEWGNETQLLFLARDIFEEAYMAFRDKDRSLLQEAQNDFERFKEMWKGSSKSANIYKIAFSGFAFTMIPF